MAKKVQLEVEVKGNDSVGKAAEKTKTLRTELFKLKEQLASGNLSGQEFDKVAKEAAKLQESIGNVNKQIKSLANNNAEIALNGFMSLANGIVGGFSAAQGAMALFGDENEDLQKQLVKIQGAIALLNGVQAINNALKKEEGLLTAANTIKTKIMTAVQARYTAAVGTSTGAMKAMRIVGMTLGIGVIVAAVGLLIANFDKVKAVVMNVVDRFKNLGSGVKNILSVMFPFIGVIRLVYAGLEKLGVFAETAADRYEKLEKATQTNMKQMQREIDLMEAQGAGARELYLAKHKLLMVEYQLMEAKRTSIGLTTEEQEAQKDLANSINILNAEETKRIKDDAEKQQQERDKANKEAQQKKKQADDKRIAEEKRVEEEIKKLKQDEAEKQRLRNKSDFELELMELQKQAEQKLELVKNDLEAQKLIRDNYEKDTAALNEKYRLQQEEKNKEIKAKKDEQDIADKEAERLRIQELADFDLQTKQNLEDAKLGIANQSAQFLQAIAGKQKGIALAALAIEKGAAIADVIIQGQRANAKLTALYPAPANVPFIAANNIRTALSVATIAATGIQGAKNISSGGGSGSGGSVQPPNIRGSQTTNEQPTPQPTKVFVTEVDIRSSLRKVDGIYTQSTII